MTEKITEEINPITPNVISVLVPDVMEKNYLTYAVSVIKDRALPDVRDGFKPVHRRILYAMHGLGITGTGAHKKSARIVGDAMGKYHPHGDKAIYDAAVGMAQDWNKGLKLIDGQGNFGSIDGDNPAAMRYTEARFTQAGYSIFDDIDKNTVDFKDNYDGSEKEPSVLPVPYPNVWVNGVDGIAVGMATYMPPHNLSETIDAVIAYHQNAQISTSELLKIMPAPDFPTGGIVHDLDGFAQALETGKGRVRLRAKWHSEKSKYNELLIVDEIPYQVNKTKLIEQITALATSKEKNAITDIQGIQDESNKEGIRICITLKKGAIAAVVFNQLVKSCELECSYSYNCVLLKGQSPMQMNFKEVAKEFWAFRHEIIRRRISHLLTKASARLHILSGFVIALTDPRKTADLILASSSSAQAQEALQKEYNIDAKQSQAVLDLKLHRLSSMEITDIQAEHATVLAEVTKYTITLASDVEIDKIVTKELLEFKAKFAVPRKSEVSYEDNEIRMEDIIVRQPCLVHLTTSGYLKRMPLDQLTSQTRGGKGRNAIEHVEGDEVQSIYKACTHDHFLAFTKSGKAVSSRVWKLPDASFASRGRHVRNIFENLSEDIIDIVFSADVSTSDDFLITVTKMGKIKKTPLSAFASTLKSRSITALGLDENDELLCAMLAKNNDHLMLCSTSGRINRFEINDESLRSLSRTANGVRGINLSDSERVCSATIVSRGQSDGQYVLSIGENGIGKKTPLSSFIPHSRGAMGVMCMKQTQKTGKVLACLVVQEDEDIIISALSKAIRVSVDEIRTTSRLSQGVKLMSLNEEDSIVHCVAVAKTHQSAAEISHDLSIEEIES